MINKQVGLPGNRSTYQPINYHRLPLFRVPGGLPKKHFVFPGTIVALISN